MSVSLDDLAPTQKHLLSKLQIFYGLGLTALLLSTLVFVLWVNHEIRIEAATRQVAAIAFGADRQLSLELRNLDRALNGIASDAGQLFQMPETVATPLLQEAVQGVDDRHAELVDVLVTDALGNPVTHGPGDPDLPRWALNPQNHSPGTDLRIGSPVQRHPGEEWVVPLAVPLAHLPSGQPGWILARLRLSEFRAVASGLDLGKQGVASITHRNGEVLARSLNPRQTLGADLSESAFNRTVLSSHPVGIGDGVSPVDGVRRIFAYRALDQYPFVVVAGLSHAEVLRPWYNFAAASTLVCVLFALGWLMLIQILLRSDRRQKALFARLLENTEHLQEVQQTAGLGAFTLDLQTRAVELSPEARRIYGFAPNAAPIDEQACLARTHPDDLSRVEQSCAGVSSGSLATDDLQYRIVQPDGSVRSVRRRSRAVVDASGLRYLTGTLLDITDLVTVRQRLDETQAQYQLLFEKNPLPFWVFDRETLRFLEVNEKSVRHYGYSREEFLAMTIRDIRPPEDVKPLEDGLALDNHSSDHVWRHLRRDGTPMQVRVVSTGITFRGRPAQLVLADDVTEQLQAAQQLEFSESRFRLVARAVSDAVFDWDLVTGESWSSESFDTLFGYAPNEIPPGIDAWRERIHPDDEPVVAASLTQAFESGATEWQAHYRFLRADGHYADVLDRGLIERDENGKALRMVGGMSDITRQRQDEAQLRLLRRAIESTRNGITIVDARAPDMPLVYVNPAFERITGYSASEVLGRNCRFLQNKDRNQEQLHILREAFAQQGQVQVMLRNYRKNGELFWNEFYLAPVRDADGMLTHYVGIQNDVTERRHYEQRLAYQSSHDELTGLLNRQALHESLQSAIAKTGASGESVTAFFLDINNFKLINGSLGHEIGDEVLRIVARRLRETVGADDRIGRLGSNEFMALIATGADDVSMDQTTATILEALAQPINASETMHYLSMSAGLARYPEHGDTPELLIYNAGVAADEAKRRGHNQLVEYVPEFDQAIGDRLQLMSRLHEAIERNEFELHFQPLFDVAQQRPIGAEALIRWRHPERGLVSPSEFIPLCEDSGLIVPLGRWILREACHRHRLLADAGWSGLTIAVNVSALQFRHGDLQQDVENLLREFSLPAGALELELTESLVMENPESVITVMNGLNRSGVLLSIDDFGTGYSSMAYLRRLPVDKLKIDRSFVTDVDSDKRNAAICESILALARNFGLTVIAEGVETQSQLDWLRTHGCDQAQGYLLARPMPFADLLTMLGPAPVSA